MNAVRVRFARPCDADAAYGELRSYGLHRVPRMHHAELEIECRLDEESEVMEEVSHALDAWLASRHLPFTPVQTEPGTLVVRPPAD